jgi:hypothetical protein
LPGHRVSPQLLVIAASLWRGAKSRKADVAKGCVRPSLRLTTFSDTYSRAANRARGAFPRAFGEAFEKELSNTPLREPVDLVAQLKANLANLRERAA